MWSRVRFVWRRFKRTRFARNWILSIIKLAIHKTHTNPWFFAQINTNTLKFSILFLFLLKKINKIYKQIISTSISQFHSSIDFLINLIWISNYFTIIQLIAIILVYSFNNLHFPIINIIISIRFRHNMVIGNNDTVRKYNMVTLLV